jgi:hypothetical protein
MRENHIEICDVIHTTGGKDEKNIVLCRNRNVDHNSLS